MKAPLGPLRKTEATANAASPAGSSGTRRPSHARDAARPARGPRNSTAAATAIISQARPPTEVAAAFRDVQSAAQDAESAENEANTYRNRVVNEAKGDAARIIQAAQGYREQAVREAQGEAARFNQIYTEYRRAPGVTRDRLYIETMQRILQNSNKVVIDSKGASAPNILPPDVFRPKASASATPSVEPAPPQAQPQRKAGQ